MVEARCCLERAAGAIGGVGALRDAGRPWVVGRIEPVREYRERQETHEVLAPHLARIGFALEGQLDQCRQIAARCGADLGIELRLVRTGIGRLDQGLDRIPPRDLERGRGSLEKSDDFVDALLDSTFGVLRLVRRPRRGIQAVLQVGGRPPALGHLSGIEHTKRLARRCQASRAQHQHQSRKEDVSHRVSPSTWRGGGNQRRTRAP